MKYKKEELQRMAWDDSSLLTKVEDNIVDNSRWSIIHDVVFRDNKTGKHYGSGYSVGATESQDESPYKYDAEEIDCQELVQKEVTMKRWVIVE